MSTSLTQSIIKATLAQQYPHVGLINSNDTATSKHDDNNLIISDGCVNGLSKIVANKLANTTTTTKVGPSSSSSSSSGYDDSSDGEDNHLPNHIHHRGILLDTIQHQHQQQSGATAIATTKTIGAANNHDSNVSCKVADITSSSSATVALDDSFDDMHLNVGGDINGRNPHYQLSKNPQQQLKQQQQFRPHSKTSKNQQNSITRLTPTLEHNVNAVTIPGQVKIRPFGLSMLPIDDFDDYEESYRWSNDEKQLRIKMSAVYRLIEIYGWSMGIYNHVTAKPVNDHQHLLIHPFGLHYNEITGSSMLKIDLAGNIVDNGSTNFELNRPGYLVHSAIHMARPDIGAVIHLHYPPVAAASAFKYGLLPICQEQALLGEIRYLDYSGILTDEDERDAVAGGLGDKCKVMILRNHGLIVCGSTIEEAFYLLQNLMKACETQARLLSLGGMDNVIFMSAEAAYQAYETVQNSRYAIKIFKQDKSDRKQGQIIGHINMFELDFEAQMRALDHAGHRTGYHYKRPLVRRTRT